MNKNPGVIFDMDGVVVDSNPVHKEVIKLFCKKYNQDVSDTILKERVYGRTNKEWIPEVFGDISSDYSNRLADEKEKMFREMFDPRSAEIPGFTAFLENLREAGIKCILATSAPGENADFILQELDIAKYFHSVLDSSDVERGKPEPDIYLKAASALNLPPGECIIFEDSFAGVEAGVRAGATVIGVTSTHTAEELIGCAKVIDSFLEISIGDLKAIANNSSTGTAS